MSKLPRCTVFVLPVLVWVLAILAPMAYASPPDPSWIPGLYDGADYDDVVVLVTSGVGVVALSLPAEIHPLPPLATSVVQRSTGCLSTPELPSPQPRAPPAR
ncbi:MAG TPA: hypothetical protein VEL75_09365 [Candidatus Methylomirabilis sp.]|nr:hypothetical protein [Candidatus Methylomirabilis sp.]